MSCILSFAIEASPQCNDSVVLVMESNTSLTFQTSSGILWMSPAARWSILCKRVLLKKRLKFGVGAAHT